MFFQTSRIMFQSYLNNLFRNVYINSVRGYLGIVSLSTFGLIIINIVFMQIKKKITLIRSF